MKKLIVKANVAFGKINLNLKLDEVGDYVQYKIVVNNATNNDYELSKSDETSYCDAIRC